LLFVFSSCKNSFVSPDLDKDTVTPLPAGMGSFTLSLSSARTIFPVAPALSEFDEFELIFTATSEGQNKTVSPEISSGSTLERVVLLAGTYNLTINAYKPGKLIAARGTKNGIVIEPGNNTPETITLRALLNETGTQGTFAWNITIDAAPITLNTATMVIKNLTGTVMGDSVDIIITSTGSRTLSTGVYNVTFSLVETDKSAVVWHELLHVYATLTSNFTHTFNADHFSKTHYTVTFNHNYSGGGTGLQSYSHGSTIESAPPEDPTRDGFTLDGWYTDETFNNKWNLTTPIVSDLTLYAMWLTNQAITFTIPSFIADLPALLPTGIILSRDDTGGHGQSAVINISGPSNYSSIEWYSGNKKIGEEESLTLFVSGVHNPDRPYDIPGTQTITVEVITNNDVFYTIDLTFTVMGNMLL